MKNKKQIFEAIEEFIQSDPTQLQISNHNGRIISQPRLNKIIQNSGFKKVDAAWECMHNISGLQFSGSRIGDLGEVFHQTFNSKLSLFVQNGSSMGNQVVALTLAHKKVLIQANSHVSVYTGLSLSNAEIVLLEPEFNQEYGIHMAVTADQIQQAIQQHPDIYAVILTSPSYEGLFADYQKIRDVIGSRYLIVDEAHGAIHYFDKSDKRTALSSGADITVSSMHKSLGTLVGTSLINVAADSKFPTKKILDAYYTFATTSPNIILLASVYDAILELNENGEEYLQNAIQRNNQFRNEIEKLDNIIIDSFDQSQKDQLKTIFGIKNVHGYQLAKILQDKYNIWVEKCNSISVIVTIHINTEDADIDKLIKAVREISKKFEYKTQYDQSINQELIYVNLTKKRKILTPLTKVMSSDKEEKKIQDCIGRISGNLQYFCPPGYPVLTFGEEISKEHVEILGQNFLIEVLVEDE
ncbi:orn/lys/arg decarboxylase major region protein (macronuclear) [Tetrahymena thermophila SB210]|uniref:Orn/lys/arg decarboxylase major region protein n=1 Tax=Tetrahymena thermophila (strain SB210) TaxID=312017 RepID=I7M7R2_TETTS|nr:orn/lys/arg decarboxylase major region protein [Tetrahymena thermophila SB210]EAR95687.1 orn/lys/arg decarboxylase major region protein [Tetrahymena thermophila SB210]|eukprot:XP_001015932.1 orn/lys/arg decarboxylase major region protein [Tetrahymena thermophila SB210]